MLLLISILHKEIYAKKTVNEEISYAFLTEIIYQRFDIAYISRVILFTYPSEDIPLHF